MSEQSGPTPEEMGIKHDVRMVDLEKATQYAVKGIAPEEYYRKRWDETILLSDELTEAQKIQWEVPQIIMFGGMSRSGKSTGILACERMFATEGIPTAYFGSDSARKPIIAEVEENLKKLNEIEPMTPEEYAKVREDMIYSKQNKERVYDAVYRAAGEELRENGGVVFVDATHLTDEKRQQAYEAIAQAYGVGELPKFTFIEISNTFEHAQELLKKDEDRRERLRKGEGTSEADQSAEHPKGPSYYPIDLSEAHEDIRKRDENTYEPMMEKHIKVINRYATAEELANHVKTMFARKPKK